MNWLPFGTYWFDVLWLSLPGWLGLCLVCAAYRSSSAAKDSAGNGRASLSGGGK